MIDDRREQDADQADRRSIARNTAVSYAYRVAYGLSVVVLTPYLFRRLGVGGFGTYSVVLGFASIFTLIELAFVNGVGKIVAEQVGGEDRRGVRATVAAANLLGVGLGGCALTISLMTAALAAGLAAPGDGGGFQLGMLLLGAIMLVRMPCQAFAAALVGFQRYDLFNAARVIGAVTWVGVTIAVVEAGGGVAGAAGAVAASLLFEGILYAVSMRRMDPSLPLVPSRSAAGRRRRIASFSSYVLLADAAIFVGHRMQPVIIAAIRSAAAAAPFAAAVRLQTGVQALVYPFVDLLVPMMSELRSRGRSGEVIRRFALATRVVLQMILPIAVGLALFATDVVEVWLGSSAPAVTAQIVLILMAVQVVTLTATPAAKVLIGIGRVRAVAALSVVEGLANLALTVVLVSAYGAIGAAIPMLMTSVLIAPIMFPLACRALRTSTSRFLRAGILPAVASSLPGIGAILAVWSTLPPSPGRLALGMGMAVAISLTIAVFQVGPRQALAFVAGAFSTRRLPLERAA